MQQTASLHEKAVQKVARDEIDFPQQRAYNYRGHRNGNLRVARVHPDVWAEVQKIAVDPSHIQILSETEVVVWDRPVPNCARR